MLGGPMKSLVAVIVFLSAIAFFSLSFFITQPQINNLLIGLAGNFVAVSLGIVLVNQFLESRARKGAVKALLLLSEQAINAFHNRWLTLCWAKFGRERFGDIGSEYAAARGDPKALPEDVRKALYEIYKQDTETQSNIRKLDEVLTELSRLTGWSLDARVLEECLNARIAISKLLAVTLDDTPEAAEAVTEHLIDTDYCSNIARFRLMKIAGIPEEKDS